MQSTGDGDGRCKQSSTPLSYKEPTSTVDLWHSLWICGTPSINTIYNANQKVVSTGTGMATIMRSRKGRRCGNRSTLEPETQASFNQLLAPGCLAFDTWYFTQGALIDNWFGFESIEFSIRNKSRYYYLTTVISVFPSKPISLLKSNHTFPITVMTFVVPHTWFE